MKKNIMTLFLVLGAGVLMAQDYRDGLRYSLEELNGTARYKAMSGAFGALGGDISAIAQNPAGSSVLNTGVFGLSLENSNSDYKTDFFGNSNHSKNSDFSLSQLGAVFVFRNYTTDSNWKKFSLGFNYQKTRDFDNQSFIYSGNNKNRGSIIEFFAENAANSGYKISSLFKSNSLDLKGGETISSIYRDMSVNGDYSVQQGFLGYVGGLIEDTGGKNYMPKAGIPKKGVEQFYTLKQYGGVNKYTFNFSGQYSDNVYLGLNLNSYSVDYTRVQGIVENGYTSNSKVKKVDFNNELHTSGGGFSLQLGAIVKATDDLRLGVNYQSPTWYTLQDELTQYLTTSIKETPTSTVENLNVSPNATNIYEKYELRTPSQWTGSIAYLFGKKGLLSLDYIYKGYGKAYFETQNDVFLENVNKDIENLFADTNSVRLGGEFRVTPQFSVRGGYRFEQSPYKDKKLMGNLNGYSFGLGYSLGGLTLDFSYDFAHRDYQYQMYNTGLTDVANVKSDNHNLLLTLSMKL